MFLFKHVIQKNPIFLVFGSALNTLPFYNHTLQQKTKP